MTMGYAQHPHMQSPGGFGSPPGMYPSPGVPQHQQQHGGGRGPPGTPQGGGMPYMPPRESYGDIELQCNCIQIGRVLGRPLDEDVGKVTDAIEVLFVRVIGLNTAPYMSYYCNEERIK